MSELIEYFVRHYTLVLDNEQGSQNAVLRAVRQAITEESPELTRERYRAMSADERNSEFAMAIGANVLALIEEWTSEVLDEHGGSMGAQLLSAVLITDGSDIAWELGVNYMPESHYDSDIEFLPEADDEDDDDL